MITNELGHLQECEEQPITMPCICIELLEQKRQAVIDSQIEDILMGAL